MIRKALIIALALVPILGLASAPSAEAAGTKVEVSFTIKISGGNATSAHRPFVSSLSQELKSQATSGRKTLADLGRHAETQVATYDRDRGDKFAPPKPGQTAAKAKWEVSLTIKVSGGSSSNALDPSDRAFLEQLQRNVQRDLETGRLGEAQVEQAVASAVAGFVADQHQAGRASGLGDKNITATISITIKF